MQESFKTMAATEGHSKQSLNTFGFNEVLNVVETKIPITTHHCSNCSNINIDNSLLIDLNHLSIVSKISEGSSSTVYEGRYKTMPVAVKMIEPSLESFGSIELRENFAREVMMLSRVKHDNLVSLSTYPAAVFPHVGLRRTSSLNTVSSPILYATFDIWITNHRSYEECFKREASVDDISWDAFLPDEESQ